MFITSLSLITGGLLGLCQWVIQGEIDTNRFLQELQTKPYVFSFTQAQYRIIKDADKDSIYYYETIEPLFGPLCTYRETKDSMSWALTGDTMTIGDFSCQKALLNFGNRSWEAWFCPDVPLSDGPYKFCGLPGLIIRVGDDTGSWLFKLEKIDRVPPIVFNLAFLDNPTTLDKMAFYKRKRYYRDNAPLLDEAAGRVIFPSEEYRQYTYKSNRENAAKDNNWIERYP